MNEEYYKMQIKGLLLILSDSSEKDIFITREYVVEKLHMILNGGIGFHPVILEALENQSPQDKTSSKVLKTNTNSASNSRECGSADLPSRTVGVSESTNQEDTSFKTKAQLNWEIGKEQEDLFKSLLFSEHIFIDKEKKEYGGFNVDELFKLIRGTEYRRGKEDAKQF